MGKSVGDSTHWAVSPTQIAKVLREAYVMAEKIGAKAAETTTAVNGLVGFRRSEIVKSFGLMAGYAAKQPKPFAKHIVNYAAEMIEVAKGTSELVPDRRDRRFKDESWQKNPLYKRGMQSWLDFSTVLIGTGGTR